MLTTPVLINRGCGLKISMESIPTPETISLSRSSCNIYEVLTLWSSLNISGEVSLTLFIRRFDIE